MYRFTAFFALLALAAVATATLEFDEGDDSKVVLASFGDASTTVSVLYRGPEEDVSVSVSSSPLYSVGTITSAAAAGGFTNFTIPLTFDKGVGSDSYTVSVGDDSVTGRCIVAGFVILVDGTVVSGDEGAGVSVGQSGSTTYDVKAVGTDGSEADLSGTVITSPGSPSYKEVDLGETKITADKFVLALNEFRVGTGSFVVNFEAPGITLNDESFETVLRVSQSTDPEPPCVAIGGDVVKEDDGIIVPMFNLLSPPKGSPVSKVVITIGGDSAEWDTSKSDLSAVDQSVFFPISASGTASITCDGEPAEIIGGDVTSSGGRLATDLISTLPDSDSKSRFDWTVRVVKSSPETLSASDASAILEKCCTVMGAEDCVIEGVESGSAILESAAHVDEDGAEGAKDDLEECFSSCTCQSELGYECEGELELGKVSVQKATAGAATAAAGGLATWTIALIAGVGAFALILVIVLGLWAVYRRSAEQSESDYSSSGPLGVPDPSDLLYEQSIVRDIYGRGDFPDGGPSQAVAEQRAREAALREEFPRPPSSSGLSRGTGTDDASSTYSV